VNIVDTHTSDPGPKAPQPERPDGGQGFMDAPWWRLLLWLAIAIIGLLLIEKLGIL
jgi:hypothetical protein